MSATACRRCIERGKAWNGGDPVCFLGGISRSWNCATLNELRDIVYEGNNPANPRVDYRYCDDMKYATVEIDDMETAQGDRIGMALWVAWYKNRGGTDAVWILDSHNPPREPTEAEMDIIIKAARTKEAPRG